MSTKWTVLRKGRPTAFERVVVSADEQKARGIYAREYKAMRQGTLKLVDPQGNIILRDSAPMVRTRW